MNESIQPAPNDIIDYWDEYYATHAPPSIPSQFAIFALGEFYPPRAIVDFGCGSGRDSCFFAQQGIFSIGVDASKQAIGVSVDHSRSAGLEGIEFLCNEVEDPTLPDRLIGLLETAGADGRPVLLYARFFLHAITDKQELALLACARSLLQKVEGSFALEFRTEHDRHQPKEVGAHFRRYINPANFLTRAYRSGFEASYFVEGLGFAKYRSDDAHVARLILKLGAA